MTEEQTFEVLERHGAFELRRYPEHLVAEVTVEGTFEGAGNAAFRPLAAYLSGRNRPGAEVAMTAPVIQRREDDEPGPVDADADADAVQQTERSPGRYVVSFVMPAEHTAQTLPVPGDARVRVRVVPEETAAALRYRGRWTRAAYLRHCEHLLRSLAEAGLRVTGPVRFARYDPPWTPWPLRRNEVVVAVSRVAPGTTAADGGDGPA